MGEDCGVSERLTGAGSGGPDDASTVPSPSTALSPVPAAGHRPAGPLRSGLLTASAAVTALLLLVMLTPAAPYAIEWPGPTVDTLGEVDGEPLIDVAGAPTYPTEGSLALTTVYSRGGPRNPVDFLRVVGAWLSPTHTVVPAEVVYPRELSPEDYADRLAAQMTTSQEDATVAALTELGYEVPAELVVVGTVPASGADGVLVAGDVVRAAGGHELATFQALVDVLAATAPGTSLPLQVDRAGERVELRVLTGADGEGGSVLGAFFDPAFDLPVDVELRIDDVGGPSAGLMFALGIIDVLTPGALTGGLDVAGTGTIAVDGAVGQISGTRLKVAAAQRDGADFFLAPLENCEEAERALADGLRVVGVQTLEQARDAVAAIGEGRVDDLPGCQA